MLGVILIVIICVLFYLFIGFGPDEAIKAVLALVWAVLILSIPVSLIVAMLR